MRVSCVRCKAMKKKCDGDYVLGTPCNNCVRTSKECQYKESRRPEYTRVLQLRVEYLESKLKEYESKQVKGNLIEYAAFIPLKNDDKPSQYVGFSGLGIACIIQSYLGDISHSDVSSENTELSAEECQCIIADIIADDALTQYYIDNYISLVQSKYPFLQLSYIHSLHARRQEIFSHRTSELYTLLMIYAIGAFLKYSGLSQKLPPNHYYLFKTATADLANVFTGENSIQSILLLVVYRLRKPSGLDSWHLISCALRLCIEAGFHRRNLDLLAKNPCEYVLRTRTFWSVYSLERIISSAFGRPVSLSDSDIDVDLPIDIDECITDPDLIKNKYYETYPHHNIENFTVTTSLPDERTSMSLAIMYFKLRIIDSQIHSSIYRVDKSFEDIPRELIASLLAKMKDWIKSLPSFLTTYEFDYCLYLFNKQIRSLIMPFMHDLEASDPLFVECIKSSINICKLNRRIHDSSNLRNRLSIISVQTVFLSGITIIYGLFSGKVKWDGDVGEGLRSCSSTLAMLGERDPGCLKYSKVFEKLFDQVSMMRLESGALASNSLVDLFGQASLIEKVNKRHYVDNMNMFHKLSSEYSGDVRGMFSDINKTLFKVDDTEFSNIEI